MSHPNTKPLRPSRKRIIWCMIVSVSVWAMTVSVRCTSNNQTSNEPLKAPCATRPRPSGIIIAGSGSGLPLLHMLRDAQRKARHSPPAKLTIPNSIGSSGGLRALADGAIDAAITTSPPPKDMQRKHSWRVVELAHTPIVFVSTHEVSGHVSIQDIESIYQTKQTRWPNQRTPVTPLKREASDGLLRVITAKHPALGEAITSGEHLIYTTDQEMLNALLEIPGSVGWLAYGMIALERAPLNVLSPALPKAKTSDALSAMPWQQTLYLVYPNTPRSDLMTFLSFIETTRTRSLMAKYGYIAPRGANDKRP